MNNPDNEPKSLSDRELLEDIRARLARLEAELDTYRPMIQAFGRGNGIGAWRAARRAGNGTT